MRNLFCFTMLAFAIFSCKKEDLNQVIYEEAINNVVLACNGQYADKPSYFFAQVNGKDMCLAEGEDGYQVKVDKWVQYTTADATLEWDPSHPNPGKYFVTLAIKPSGYSGYREYIQVQTPAFDSALSTNKILERVLHTGDLPFVKTSAKDDSVFQFSLVIPVATPKDSTGAWLVELTSCGKAGSQNKLTLQDLKVDKTPVQVNYDLLFSVQCNLWSLADPIGYYGSLTKGTFRVQFSLPADE